MRRLVSAADVREFMQQLAARVHNGYVYLTGGAPLVLLGLRDTAIDIDLISDDDNVLRAAAALRDELGFNVDREQVRFAAPGWEERSAVIARESAVSFHHLDWYAHALANLERGHTKDLTDVRKLLQRGLVDAQTLQAYARQLLIDPASFRRAVESLQ